MSERKIGEKNSKIGYFLPLVLSYVDAVKVSNYEQVSDQGTDSDVVECLGNFMCCIIGKSVK